jgi:hypothetical protein
VNGYLRLWLTWPLLSACCGWRLYLCRSQEWAEHSPNPSGFVYLELSWAPPPLLQAFPFPSTLEEVVLHPLSQAIVFIYSSRGKWHFSPLLWSFPPTATFTSFPAPGCGRVPPLLPSLASLFTYSSMRDCPSPLLSAQGTCPLCYMSFLFPAVCLLFSLFFSLGGSWCVQGATLIWPRFVCGSTACRLAHLVVCFSQAG